MPTDARLEDRVLVRELYGRYALAAAQIDVEAWIEAWAQDGHWKISTFDGSGHARLREQWDEQWTHFENVAVINEVGPITFSGDTAHASCCVREVAKMKDGKILLMTGIYDDEMKRENGAWRFARREYKLLSEQVTG